MEDIHPDVDALELGPPPTVLSRRVGDRRTWISSGSPFEATTGFSRAIRSGSRVLVSGTGPVWPDHSCPDHAGVQARRCFKIIGRALAEAGVGWNDVLRTRMFVTDLAACEQVAAVHGDFVR